MTQEMLKTNHSVRVVTLTTAERVLALFGDIREEEDGKVWMPSFHNVEGKGMVFANGSGRDDWAWAGVQHVEVTKEESEKYKGAKHRADMTTLKLFAERDFMDALSYVGLLP